MIIGRRKLFERNMLLLLELGAELFRIAFVKVNKCRFGHGFVNLTQTAARGLQNHVCRAVALLRKNYARKTATIPALLAYLNKKNYTYF